MGRLDKREILIGGPFDEICRKGSPVTFIVREYFTG